MALLKYLRDKVVKQDNKSPENGKKANELTDTTSSPLCGATPP